MSFSIKSSVVASSLLAGSLLVTSVSAMAGENGFYLRLDAGASVSHANDWKSSDLSQSFDAGTTTQAVVGLGAGYRFSPLLRLDLSLSYRPESALTHTDNGAGLLYKVKESSLRGFVTGYVDGQPLLSGVVPAAINPYVGFGVGMTRNRLANVAVTDLTAPTFASQFTINGATRNHFAWQAVAGLGYDVTDRITLDVSYHYIDAGSVRSGGVLSGDGVSQPVDPLRTSLVTSELVTALRWRF
ncbi:MAG: porin family protein [Telmatospirillum sp.]|nr:porin family protein [Telmatospirillum sp.]